MSDPVLDALRRNLANSHEASQADKVKRIKARIAQLEKAAAPKLESAPKPAVSNLAAPDKGKK